MDENPYQSPNRIAVELLPSPRSTTLMVVGRALCALLIGGFLAAPFTLSIEWSARLYGAMVIGGVPASIAWYFIDKRRQRTAK